MTSDWWLLNQGPVLDGVDRAPVRSLLQQPYSNVVANPWQHRRLKSDVCAQKFMQQEWVESSKFRDRVSLGDISSNAEHLKIRP